MKENDKEESDNSSINNLIDNSTNNNIDNKNKNKEYTPFNLFNNNLTTLRTESQSSFDKAIINKIKKEENELKIQIELKERKKLLKKVIRATRKDYIFFFFLLISSSFNYNYLFLPFIAISMLYLLCIEKFNKLSMRWK